MSRLYFDYNASAPLSPLVIEELKRILDDDFKNPSSVHFEGRKAKKQIEGYRTRISSHLSCLPEEICFTSGASEANNTVFHSVWCGRQMHRTKIISTPVEHESVLRPLEHLKSEGAEIVLLEINRKGEIDLSQLASLVDEKTLLVSLMTANNETGILFPIREAASLAHQMGARFHTDAACAIGKINFRFDDIDADFVTLAGHKFHAPKGVGALLVRKGVSFESLILGGHHEEGRRAGTENIFGIAGLSTALDYAMSSLDAESKRLFDLREKLKQGLKSTHASVSFHENLNHQLPGTLNAAFPGLSGQTLLTNLDLEGVAASYGAACQSGSLEVSRVLLAMGIPENEASSSIRLSFGSMTTEWDIDGLLGIMSKVLERMKIG